MATYRALLRERLKGRMQKELAAELGVTPAFLCMVLKGKRPPGRKILRALGMRKVVSYEARA
jgi:transcriptional regulator with XRE-family HTH domain